MRSARVTMTSSPCRNAKPRWPSKVTNISSGLDSAAGRTLMRELPGITIGRLPSECGAIGVSSSASTLGCTIGPPAARLYAVDPVGLARIKPSALTSRHERGRPRTPTARSSARSRAFVTTTSFSTMCVARTESRRAMRVRAQHRRASWTARGRRARARARHQIRAAGSRSGIRGCRS